MKLCAARGCSCPARRRYCSSECASRDRQRRYRERLNYGGVRLSFSVSIETSAATAFGVEYSSEVADLFAEDAERFRSAARPSPRFSAA